MSAPITFVKLGGSVITDKERPRAARRNVIERLATELAEAVAAGCGPVVLGHGSGSFGHPEALAHRLDLGATTVAERRGAGKTQREARDLHRLVVEALHEAGLAPFSISPGSLMVTASGRVVDCSPTALVTSLDGGFLPVVFGDVVPDRDQGVSIASTETVFGALATALFATDRSIGQVIWLGNTDGVLDERGEPIDRIGVSDDVQALRFVGGAAGPDITGGMVHRVESALALARLGIPSVIANGDRPDILRDLMTGFRAHGTRVTP